MNGGSGDASQTPSGSTFSLSPDFEREVQIRVEAARERARSDAEVLAADPLAHELIETLTAAVDGLLEMRWLPRSPHVVGAAGRILAQQQARLDAAFLKVIHAIDERDDVAPGAKPGRGGAALLRESLGLESARANRESDTARLLSSDLAAVGAAFAAGQITRAHVNVALSVHSHLRGDVREAIVPTLDPVTGEVRARRCIDVVDATLAEHARVFSVPELTRIGNRIVENLDPPTPDGAHERRYLHLSRLADGSLIGKFACGPGQALALTAAIAAGSAPRPGVGVDADGVEHQLPDQRTSAQRALDALVDAATHGCPGPRGTTNPKDDNKDVDDTDDTDDDDTADDGGCDGGLFGILDPPEPPEREGEVEVRPPPGVRTGPHPDVQIVVTATLEQFAHALHQHTQPGARRPIDPAVWPPGSLPDKPPEPPGPPDTTGTTGVGPGFARARHGDPVHPSVLGSLACSGRLRRALLDDHGAVLHLGRSHRLATAAQRTALLARDAGCVIPGCAVPGDRCEVHHVTPWFDGGATDVPNLVLVCARHHIEVGDGTWHIHMINGVPWSRPPAWAHSARPLLRNASHR